MRFKLLIMSEFENVSDDNQGKMKKKNVIVRLYIYFRVCVYTHTYVCK